MIRKREDNINFIETETKFYLIDLIWFIQGILSWQKQFFLSISNSFPYIPFPGKQTETENKNLDQRKRTWRSFSVVSCVPWVSDSAAAEAIAIQWETLSLSLARAR